jgi:Flp pilus assembly protein TadG
MLMKPAVLIARARRSVRRLRRDERGISAVEFAMLAPLMVVLYLGGVEISQGIAIDRKVTLVARTLGDLTAQATSVTSSDMTGIFKAAAAVVAPFDDKQLTIKITSVKIDSQGKATVAWSDGWTNGAAAGTPPYSVGSTVNLDAALKVANTYLIWAEARYDYTSPVDIGKAGLGHYLIGSRPLNDQIYLRPRLSDCVLRQGVQSTC